MRRTGVLAGGVLGAALLVSPAPARTAPRPPACFAPAFSPGFARDRTVFCVTSTLEEGTWLYRSTDAGRTWHAGRRVTTREVHIPDLVVSPMFPTDRTLWVVSGNDGMWLSRDAGETFGREEPGPLYGGYRATTFVEPLPVPRGAFVEAGLTLIGSGVYDAVTGSRNVLGTPTSAEHFIVPPGYGPTRQAVGIGEGPSSPAGSAPLAKHLHAYLCDHDFTCTKPLVEFGAVDVLGARRIAPGDDVVVTVPWKERDKPFPPPSTLRAWRSRDYGRTWTRWPAMERLYVGPRGRAEGGYPYIEVTKSAEAPRRLFAHTDRPGIESATVPRTQLWRSDDDGRTWRRIGYSWGRRQPKAGQGTLPWNDPGHSIGQVLPWISAQPGGYLYAIGAHRVGDRVTRQHLWCSRDLGRTWRPAC